MRAAIGIAGLILSMLPFFALLIGAIPIGDVVHNWFDAAVFFFTCFFSAWGSWASISFATRNA